LRQRDIAITGRILEHVEQPRVVGVRLDDVHFYDAVHLFAFGEQLAAALHDLFAEGDRRSRLGDQLAAGVPQDEAERDAQKHRDPDQVRGVLQLKVPIQQEIPQPPLTAVRRRAGGGSSRGR